MRDIIALVLLEVLCVTSIPTYAADGCAAGMLSRIVSPDGNAVSFLFDDFSVIGGGDSGIRTATTQCNLLAPVSAPGGYSVFSVDYRGFAAAGDGQTVSIASWQQGKGQVFSYTVAGPLQANVAVGHRIGISDHNELELGIEILAEGPLNADPAAGLFIDSVDLARIGFTTGESVQDSVDQLAKARQSIATELMESTWTILDQPGKLDGENSLSVLGSSGTVAIGVIGRWANGTGLSFLGGAVLAKPQVSDPITSSPVIFAGAARYVTQGQLPWHAFAEIGLSATARFATSFSRRYINLDRTVQAEGSTSAMAYGGYARLGAIYAPDDDNEWAVAAKVARSFVNVAGYSEGSQNNNLFAAILPEDISAFTTWGADVSWTHRIDERFDLTLSGGFNRTFGKAQAVTANVNWVGPVKGTTEDWDTGRLAARIGWKPNPKVQFNTTFAVSFEQESAPRYALGGEVKALF